MATSVGASLVQQAGVVALLNPKNTAGVARAACILIGAAYPVYRTFKALERRRFLFDNSRDGVLTYWSVFGCLSMAEAASEPLFQLFPWYYHCKLGFIVWLQSHQGADKLYKDYIKPLLLKHESKVDGALTYVDKEVNTHVYEAGSEVGQLFRAARAVRDTVQSSLGSLFNSSS